MRLVLSSFFFFISTYSFYRQNYAIPISDWIKEFNLNNNLKSQQSYQLKTDAHKNIYVASKKNVINYSVIKRNATLHSNFQSKQTKNKQIKKLLYKYVSIHIQQ